ncbi:MAG: hypothetical protein KDD46_04135 [Bdellovibrionales bacterium]|nr:hypothetical protein [Bdellovibrionales bacterium]
MQVYVKKSSGISIIEALVTMVVLTIVFLGMAGTLTVVTQTKGDRSFYESTVKIAKAKISGLSNVSWEALATGSTSDEKLLWGAPDAEVVSLGFINEFMEQDTGSNDGPFIYFLHFVTCVDDTHADYDSADDAEAEDGDPCTDDVSAQRPNSLYCDSSQTDEGEIMVRVSVSFLDRTGRCREASFERIVSDL